MIKRIVATSALSLLSLFGAVSASAGAASAAADTPTRVDVVTAATPRPSYSDPRAAYTNGCTLSPDGVPGFYNFRDICNRHDICYARYPDGHHQYGTNETGRYICDLQFRNEMRNYCTNRFGRFDPRRYSCYGIADTYYSAVRKLGWPFYYDYNTNW